MPISPASHAGSPIKVAYAAPTTAVPMTSLAFAAKLGADRSPSVEVDDLDQFAPCGTECATHLARSEPARPAAAALDVPEVGLRGVSLLDPDEREVATERGEVRRLDVERQPLEVGGHRHRIGPLLCGQRTHVSGLAPGGQARLIERAERVERLSIRGVRLLARHPVVETGDPLRQGWESDPLPAPDDHRARAGVRDLSIQRQRRRRAAGGRGAASSRGAARHGVVSTVAEALCRRDGAGRCVPVIPAAAPTKSRKSGCGRFGRLFSSGCACVATNHGWSRSSMYSTRRPSGETPLNAHAGRHRGARGRRC